MHFWRNAWKNRSLVALALPAVIAFIMFSYLPMFGLLLAFKRFDFSLGIFNSPWVGLENFKFLFASGGTMWRITHNTVGYFLVFTMVNTLGSVFLAIGINELAARKLGKFFQSSMILPTFISWVAVSFIVNAFLREDTGLVNKLLVSMDMNAVSWYIKPKAWPFILAIVNAWKGIGYGSVLFLSVLTGIDPELYAAAYRWYHRYDLYNKAGTAF